MSARSKSLALALFISIVLIAALRAIAAPPSSTSTVGISVQIGDVSPVSTGSGGAGSGGEVIIPLKGEATIVLEGFVFPGAFLTFLRNGSVMGTGVALEDGRFRKEIKTDSRNAVFGIWARDNLNLLTPTTNFSLTLPDGAITTVKNIFLSPTIKLSNSVAYKGLPLRFAGSSFPGANIYFFVNGEPGDIVQADHRGVWKHELSTKLLNEGFYKIMVRGRLADRGLISPFSEEIMFNLQAMPRRGDFNGDGRVNIVDFSIVLFYWHQENPNNPGADLNFDAVVDIADISALMYLWTG